ncbi:homoprotocatechuate degradation operon regulator, HpaR, hpaR [Lactococcus cremoris]|uniref:Homoprotocatechuate degradation operon regulator, HpaR, hpaR n=2 Tax=Lactococcus lactis subsp. cremoris TaxID=1359 RepID=A0ABR5EHK9_LACLC|nr:homoprotocatechuate degradation operon regulator, HpaR, hpaR [Lactococcus cremoris]
MFVDEQKNYVIIIRMRTKKEAIGRLLKVASNQMSREFDNFAAQLDLTGQQMSILDFLGNQSEEGSGKEISQTMIELEFNIRRSTTTEILQRMEKRLLINRRTSLTDARQKSAELTEEGKRYLPEIRAYIQAHNKKALTGLSTEEIAAVEKFLNNFSVQEGRE